MITSTCIVLNEEGHSSKELQWQIWRSSKLQKSGDKESGSNRSHWNRWSSQSTSAQRLRIFSSTSDFSVSLSCIFANILVFLQCCILDVSMNSMLHIPALVSSLSVNEAKSTFYSYSSPSLYALKCGDVLLCQSNLSQLTFGMMWEHQQSPIVHHAFYLVLLL